MRMNWESWRYKSAKTIILKTCFVFFFKFVKNFNFRFKKFRSRLIYTEILNFNKNFNTIIKKINLKIFAKKKNNRFSTSVRITI